MFCAGVNFVERCCHSLPPFFFSIHRFSRGRRVVEDRIWAGGLLMTRVMKGGTERKGQVSGGKTTSLEHPLLGRICSSFRELGRQ